MHQIEELDKDPLLAARTYVALHSLFYITPGILQIFMGDEYFSSLPFSRQPEELDRNLAGDYHNGVWSTQGSHIGFFKFTQTMLKLRRLHSVGVGVESVNVVVSYLQS